MVLTLRIVSIAMLVVLAASGVGCSGGGEVYKQNVEAVDAIERQELGEMDAIHRLDVHLDEGDELYDKYERPFAQPVEEHPPTR